MVLVMLIVTPLLALEPIRRTDTVEDRLVPLFTHRLSNLEWETESVVEGSAVVVGTVVGEGGDVVYAKERWSVGSETGGERYDALCSRYPYNTEMPLQLEHMSYKRKPTHMSSVDLDEIEAGLFTPLHCILERLLELFDLGRGHLLRNGI